MKKDIAYFKLRLKKVCYYLSETIKISLPADKKLNNIQNDLIDNPKILDRVNYYCKDMPKYLTSDDAVEVGKFKKSKSFAYYADTKRIVKNFPKNYKFNYVFGDVVHIPETPSFVKSRPISDGNQNSVLLKLNAIRHYQFLEDKTHFIDKKGVAVWRGHIHQEHRTILVNKFYANELCNIGHCDDEKDYEESYKGFLSVDEQLQYKYIISIEGKDVATNLKWIMSSNSLCFMRKPRFETWYMEGKLVAGVHYVQLKDDFSDLEEKIIYFNKNADEALVIIANAQAYTKQFLDKKTEEVIGVMVAEKYFKMSKQLM